MSDSMHRSKKASFFRLKTEFLFFIFFAILVIILFNMTFYKLNEGKIRYVLLSFDVDSNTGHENISAVLSILDSFSEDMVNATFFVTGRFIEENPEIANKMLKYEVACLGYDNSRIDVLDYVGQSEHIELCRDALQSLNITVLGFKAPGKRITKMMYAVLEATNFRYDATQVEYRQFLYPPETIQEIPISTSFFLALEDKGFFGLIPPIFYFLAEYDGSVITSVNFQPDKAVQSKELLKGLIKSYIINERDIVNHKRMSELLETQNI